MGCLCRAMSSAAVGAYALRAATSSTAISSGVCRRPRTISFARAVRQALARRGLVLGCALLECASGIIVASRSISVLAETAGSAINHPWTTGHESANGSTRVRYPCLAVGCLRWIGRASFSFDADVKLATKSAIAGMSATTAPHRPWAAMALSVC